MLRASLVIASILVASLSMIGGCGGGDDGGGGEAVYIVGDWVGSMEHRIIDYNNGTDTTVTYTIVFYILSQDGNSVRGKLQLQSPAHVGDLRGTMDGNRFRGVRTGAHTVQIEFTVHGDSLTGTFRFEGDGLNEWGNYTCAKR